MDVAKEIRKGESLDWDKLEGYLKSEIPELEGKMEVAQFHGGHANLTYEIKFGETELVLRRPPFGKIAPGAHDMKREYKVLSKLYKHFPRAPRAYHLCEDESVIGARFVVMERRKGVVVRVTVPECFQSYEKAEDRMVDALIKATADLHLVDYQAADLEKLGRPEGFVKRQVEGWTKRWELSKTEDVEDMDEVGKILAADMPISPKVSIIHNDLKLDNCQFQSDNPDMVTSIFDWDMCTLGDPLVDFGTLLCYHPDKNNISQQLTVKLKGNYPPKSFLIDKYQEYTGFSMDRIAWYEAFSFWKVAVIAQQLYKRFVDGDSQDERMIYVGQTVKHMAAMAREVLTK